MSEKGASSSIDSNDTSSETSFEDNKEVEKPQKVTIKQKDARVKKTSAKSDRKKTEKSKAGSVKSDKSKVDPNKRDMSKADLVKSDKSKADSIKSDKSKTDSIKNDKSKSDPIKTDKSKAGSVESGDSKIYSKSDESKEYSKASKGSKVHSRKTDSKKSDVSKINIDYYRKCIKFLGLRLNYKKIFEGCDNDKQKKKKLIEVIREAGVEDRITLKACEKLGKKLALKMELEELDSDAVIETKSRSCRNRILKD